MMKYNDNTKDSSSFADLPLQEALFNNLASLDYHVMTPIQQQSLPLMLTGADLIAQAKTGSGKTAAFGLTLLNAVNPKYFGAQGLVLCPTRELAEQVTQTLRKLARLIPNIKILNLSGGAPIRPQVDSLKHGAHLIVGTPGRIQKHVDSEALSLKQVKILVLDEADRMLDMGFYDAIESLISCIPSDRQTLLFSATYPAEIKKISQKFMKNPAEICIDIEQHHIEQHFYELKNPDQKFAALTQLLLFYKPQSTIVFCNTKQQTTELAKALNKAGFHALALNGDMEQLARDQVIIRFINQSCSILVATDVAARGIDIKKLSAVINYEVAFEPEVHTHRIGRTGRAGEEGLAISLTTPADAQRICAIENQMLSPIQWEKIDTIPQNQNMMPLPAMVTICFDAGRRDKIRAGDILGALTKDGGLAADCIGKIDVANTCTYVAVARNQVDTICHHFKQGKLKGRSVQVRRI